jgi:hypothetical protein
MTTLTAEPALLTEDEAVAIALICGSAWPVPLRTVDVDDEVDLSRSGARGARSLRLRGAISDDEHMALSPDLLVVESVAGAVPRALGAAVDEADRILPTSPLLVVLTASESVYAVRVDPDGVVSAAQVTVQLAADLLVGALMDAEAGARFVVRLMDSGGGPAGGLRRAGDQVQRTDSRGAVVERGAAVDDRAAVTLVVQTLRA